MTMSLLSCSPDRPSDAAVADAAPFRGASPRALALLIDYALEADATAPARVTLLEPLRPRPEPGRERSSLLRALEEAPWLRGALDAVLGSALQGPAEAWRERPVAWLAEAWAHERHHLRGPRLAALLWSLARRNGASVRPLEARVARACTRDRLLDGGAAPDPAREAGLPGVRSRLARASDPPPV